MDWLIASIIAMISFGFMAFLIRFLPKGSLRSVSLYMAISSIIIFLFSLQERNFNLLEKRNIVLIISISLLTSLGVIFQFRALQTAKNPGLASMIISLSFIVVLILSLIFLRSPLTYRQVIGIILAILSIILVV